MAEIIDFIFQSALPPSLHFLPEHPGHGAFLALPK
jgi:hypothetical protein